MNNSELRKNLKRGLSSIVGTSMFILTLTGCNPTSSMNRNDSNTSYVSVGTIDVNDTKGSSFIDVPNVYMSYIRNALSIGNIKGVTEDDLLKIKRISIVADEEDLSWLNNCNNLQDLNFYISRDNDVNTFEEIQSLSSLESIVLSPLKQGYSFDENNFGFLLNCPNLKSIHLNGFDFIDENFVNKLENITEMVIELNPDIVTSTVNSNIDFTKLKKLEKLKLVNVGLYNAAIYLDNNDLDVLIKNNVSIDFNYDFTMEELRQVNMLLDDMVSDLHITSEMTDTEKLNCILEYVLSNLSYNETSKKIQEKNGDASAINATMYVDGFLYAIINNDSAICGNYAGLFQALANRIGMESYFITSETHAWNLVNIDDEYYYVDSTRLDNVKVELEGEEGMFLDFYYKNNDNLKNIPWYMEKLSDASKDDNKKTHIPTAFPEFIGEEYNYDSNYSNNNYISNISSYDLSNKHFLVNGKHLLDSKTLICILIVLGIAKKVNVYDKTSKKKR